MPLTRMGSEDWFMLSYFGRKHVIRFQSLRKGPLQVRDPNDHRLNEIKVEGKVKWKPQDPGMLNIEDVPPLGPRQARRPR